MNGLAEQLLGVVVAHERPELDVRYEALVNEMSDMTNQQVQLEDTLLHELSNSKGNILDNTELIQTLATTKEQATIIEKKLSEAATTKKELMAIRVSYMPVAKRGSIVYFAIASLSNITSMYETSLNSYLTVFNRALDSAKRDGVFNNRLRNMTVEVTEQSYDVTCTGIFERHKLLFSFVQLILYNCFQAARLSPTVFIISDPYGSDGSEFGPIFQQSRKIGPNIFGPILMWEKRRGKRQGARGVETECKREGKFEKEARKGRGNDAKKEKTLENVQTTQLSTF